LNYLSNAIKFTDSGHIVIKVSLQDSTELPSGQLMLKFSVRDTGIGISQEDQAKLFSLFSQVDDNYTRRFEGTGLGLYIVKNIVELMSGTVGLSSEPGFGSTFWFTAVVRAGSARYYDQPTLTPEQSIGMRVLLVDDNDDTRTVLNTGLGRKGVNVTCMSTGESAMDFLLQQDSEGHPIEAVIMDWYLPSNSGVYFAQKIRALPLQKMPVILCLTSKDVAEMSIADRDSFDSILTKPIDTMFLRNSLMRMRQQQHGRSVVAVRKTDVATRETPLLANKRVLLVDDDRVGLKLAEIILSRHGANCVSCLNGKEAVQILSNDNKFDIVLMDIEMPELDGISAINILREMPALQGVRICVITAHVMHADLAKIDPELVSDVLTKPYTADQLIAFVKQWACHDKSSAVQYAEVSERLLLSILGQLRNGDPTVCDQVKLHSENLRIVLQQDMSIFLKAIDSYDFEKSVQLLEPRIAVHQASQYSATHD
jgi:CheY-like chemotaxis protein